ncbi:MAG: GEVED domain-containing protein [Acidobacteriota bacterium]|nr:GEVED domain-containing protein [Acidobacteriota bacterium]
MISLFSLCLSIVLVFQGDHEVGDVREQIVPNGSVISPDVSIIADTTLTDLETLNLTTSVSVCAVCTPSFLWRAGGGELTTALNPGEATWNPPAVFEPTRFQIDVKVQDGNGQIAQDQITVMVNPSGSGGTDPTTLNVIAPNGGETLASGETTPILWTADQMHGDIFLELISGATTFTTIGPLANTGSYVWPIPGTLSGSSFLVRVRSADGLVADTSDGFFSISQGERFHLTLAVNGSGRIVSTPPGIDCPGNCSGSFARDAEITLTPAPDANAFFSGWSGGGCWGSSPCTITLDRDRRFTANFGGQQAFGVLASAPSDGETGVDTRDSFRVTFSENILDGPNIDSITVTGPSGPLTRSVTRGANSPYLFIDPQNMENGVDYTVTLPAGCVTNEAGEPFAGEYSFAFTTRQPMEAAFFITAYPPMVVENQPLSITVWYDRVQDEARTITFTSSSPQDISPNSVTIPAGANNAVVTVTADSNSVFGDSKTVTLTANTSDGKQASDTVEYVNNDPSDIGPLRLAGLGFLSNDDDGDGVFEAEEDADLNIELHNSGSSLLSNVWARARTVSTFDSTLRVLGTAECTVGSIGAGNIESCSVGLRADDDLPTGDYWIEITGVTLDGSGNPTTHFIDYLKVHVVNELFRDFRVTYTSVSSSTGQPGQVFSRTYVAVGSGDNYVSSLPQLRIMQEHKGVQSIVHETLADVPGWFNTEQSFVYDLVAPQTPGVYQYWAEINPPGPGQQPESDPTNNESTRWTLNIPEANLPPALTAVGAQVIPADQQLVLSMIATDPNAGDVLSFSLTEGPAGAAVNPTTGEFSWIPGVNQAPGTHQITIQVTDNGSPSHTDTATFQVETTLESDVAVGFSIPEEAAVPGLAYSYQMLVINNGPHPAVGLKVDHLLPVILENGSWTSSGQTRSMNRAGIGDIHDTVDLDVGQLVTYSITGTVSLSASGALLLSASLDLPAGSLDPGSSNNTREMTAAIVALDYGDAPDSGGFTYPTGAEADGARHVFAPGLFLGSGVDADDAGQADAQAAGDDNDGLDDEDGVVFLSAIQGCLETLLQVTASAGGFLDAWIDFNADGDWLDAGERVFTAQTVAAGVNNLSFQTPCETVEGSSFSRFRYSTAGNLDMTGQATDGEVEDHQVTLSAAPACVDTAIGSLDNVQPGASIIIPVTVSALDGLNVESFTFAASWDASMLTLETIETAGSLSEGMTVSLNDLTPGQVIFSGAGTADLTGSGELFRLQFKVALDVAPSSCGVLTLDSFTINEGFPTTCLTNGQVCACPLGDVTANGDVTAFDAVQVLKHATGLTTDFDPIPLCSADVTCNGSISAFDAAQILKFDAALIMEFPCQTSRSPNAMEAAVSFEPLPADRADQDLGPFVLPVGVRTPSRTLASLQVMIDFDPELVTVRVLRGEGMPDGWLLSVNDALDGRLVIAAAGIDPPDNASDILKLWVEPIDEGMATFSVVSFSANETEHGVDLPALTLPVRPCFFPDDLTRQLGNWPGTMGIQELIWLTHCRKDQEP